MGNKVGRPKKTDSQRFRMMPSDWSKWRSNTLLFLAPVALIYLGQVTGALSIENHTFDVSDLLPSRFTWGAIVLYVSNTLTDIIRKFVSETHS